MTTISCKECPHSDVGGHPTHLCPDHCSELKWHNHPCATCKEFWICDERHNCSHNLSGEKEEFDEWCHS